MKAKNLLYLLMIVGLLAGTWALPVAADEPGASTDRAPAGIESLSGSLLAFDNGDQGYDFCAAPGTTQTFCFWAEVYTPDWTYAYDPFLSFPSDWVVLNAWDNGPDYCDSGSWTFYGWGNWDGPWEMYFDLSVYTSSVDHCYTYLCAEVITGSVGDASWYWDSDEYGAAPNHPCSDDGYTPTGMPACDEMVNPVASIPPCEEGIYVMPEYQAGEIEPGTSEDFDLTVLNMSGMEEYVDIGYLADGPGDCYGPTYGGPIGDGDTWPFSVTVEMDPGAQPGDIVGCQVIVDGENSGYGDIALIEAQPRFPGPEAYALDVYPGYQLVHWPDLEVPGTWNLIGSVPQFHPAGDFLGTDFTQMYAFDYDSNEFVSIDIATGARTVIGTSVPTGNWTGMTGTADGSALYASSSVCGTESYLYEIDPASGAATLIGPMGAGSCMIDIAINAAGEMYGVDIVDDSLYAIDTGTGAATYIGSTGASANYAQGMDFDFATNTLYWAAYTTGGELRILDTGSGMSTLIGPFPGGNEVDCLAIPGEGGPENTMHVENMFLMPDYPFLNMRVQVADQDGMPLGDVVVDAAVTSPFAEWGRWRMTKPNGWSRFWSLLVAPGYYEICVGNLELEGYAYNPGDNVYDCMGWDYMP